MTYILKTLALENIIFNMKVCDLSLNLCLDSIKMCAIKFDRGPPAFICVNSWHSLSSAVVNSLMNVR